MSELNFIFNVLFNPDIAFDGWAVALIVLILSILGVGTGCVVKKTKVRQSQKAGIDSVQKQKVKRTTTEGKSNISQTQKAKGCSDQTQEA